MLLSIAHYSLFLLLWLSLYICIVQLGKALLLRRVMRSRLMYRHRRSKWVRTLMKRWQQSPAYNHVAHMMETLGLPLTVQRFFQLTALMFVLGTLLGSLLFMNVKGVLFASIMFSASPYVILRMLIVNKQMKMRLDFLPAVEVFYQYYVLSAQKNLRSVLNDLLQEERLMYPIAAPFAQLAKNLATQREVEATFHVFSLSFGHRWGRYFITMLRVALDEGVDISADLQQLITDMRQAQRTDQMERNKLLEIRIANFSPIVFLVIFVFINFKMNDAQAYHYYFVDQGGKNLMLDALFLIFASFVMGLWLSIKRL